MKKLATVGSLIVTSTLVFSSMPFQNAHADTTSMNVPNKQSQINKAKMYKIIALMAE